MITTGTDGAAAAAQHVGDEAGGGNSTSTEGGEQSEEPLASFRGIVRAKGTMWIANAHSFPIVFHAAGKQLSFEGAELPFRSAICDQPTFQEHVEAGRWRPEFGDRKSELVFIGVQLDEEILTEQLEGALLTEQESAALGGVPGWKDLADPILGGVCAQKYFNVPEHLRISSGNDQKRDKDSVPEPEPQMQRDADSVE
jgi:hypothetical protein